MHKESEIVDSLDGVSDERLMLAYRDGNGASFRQLYARYRTPLYRYFARQCGDSHLAEELFQDVWLRVIHARASYEPLATFATWLYRIAHHRLIDHYRQHARHLADSFADDDEPDALPAADTANPARQHEQRDIAKRLGMALKDLPPAQREAFLMAEEGGLSLNEIAAATGTARETVKSRLRYALGKLRHSLQDCL